MSMSCANYTKHFTNMGDHVDLWNIVHAWRATVRTQEAEYVGDMKDTEAETRAAYAALEVTQDAYGRIDGIKDAIVSKLEEYILDGLADDLVYTGASPTATKVLVDLVEDMIEASQTVRECTVAAGTPTYDAQNTGTCCMSAPVVTQLVKNETFEFDISTYSAGASTWGVTGSERSKALNGATSAAAYTAYHEDLPTALRTKTDAGTLFTTEINEYTAGTGYEIAGDADGELGASTWTGAVKGVTGASSPNTDAQGDVYCVLDRLSAGESGDGSNQLSGWDNVTGIVLGKNCDTDGKLHASIIDDTGGFYHVGLYKAAARAVGDLVGHTATYNGAGAKAVVADNSSGLGGTITVDAVVGVDVDIYYVYAFDRVKVYKESGLSNLVAAGGLVAGGSTTLYAQNSSGLGGTIVVAYSDGEASVQVRVGFACAAGDKIYMATTTDDNGLFVKFFRDQLGIALNTAACGSETIAETLAQ